MMLLSTSFTCLKINKDNIIQAASWNKDPSGGGIRYCVEIIVNLSNLMTNECTKKTD